MIFSYREILKILSQKHGVRKDKMVAFRGRLQHFQRLGFPSGLNTGKGNTANYGWRELFLLALALEYLEIGSTPDRSVNEIVKFEDMLLSAVARVTLANEQQANPAEFRCFLIVELSNLMLLKQEENWNNVVKLLSYNDIQLILSTDGVDSFRSPYALVDLRQFLAALLHGCFENVAGSERRIVADLRAWSEAQLLEIVGD